MQSTHVEESGFSHAIGAWQYQRAVTSESPQLIRSPSLFEITNPLKTFLTFATLLAVAVAVLLYLKKRGLLEGKATAPWPFYVKKPLTQPEQVLYHRLIRALPEHIVLAQVQVSRVLGVKKGSRFNEWIGPVHAIRGLTPEAGWLQG
jgi:hypothetical protein